MVLHFSQNCGQDVIRCTICETALAFIYCENCHVDLCKDCPEKHLSDKDKGHKLVPLKQYLYTPTCRDHQYEQCNLHCEDCNIPISSTCIVSKRHIQHEIVHMKEHCSKQKDVLRQDLYEFDNKILPKYREAISTIVNQKAVLRKETENFLTALRKQGLALHTEVTAIVNSKESEVKNAEDKQLAMLEKQEMEINQSISEISQITFNLQELLKTGNPNIVSRYRSRTGEFRDIPHQLNICLPIFNPQKINRTQLLEHFGFHSFSSIRTEDQDSTLEFPVVESSSPDRQLLTVPQVEEIDMGYGSLHNVCCLNDEKIWSSGRTDTISLHNLLGKLLETVKTDSMREPLGIAVTQFGDLMFTDYSGRFINIVKNKQIHLLIKLQDWRPRGLCCTISGDVLVIMGNANNDDDDDDTDNKNDAVKETKVVR